MTPENAETAAEIQARIQALSAARDAAAPLAAQALEIATAAIATAAMAVESCERREALSGAAPACRANLVAAQEAATQIRRCQADLRRHDRGFDASSAAARGREAIVHAREAVEAARLAVHWLTTVL